MTMISRFLFGPFRPGIETQRPELYRIAIGEIVTRLQQGWTYVQV
jgi:hypothetical protein